MIASIKDIDLEGLVRRDLLEIPSWTSHEALKEKFNAFTLTDKVFMEEGEVGVTVFTDGEPKSEGVFIGSVPPRELGEHLTEGPRKQVLTWFGI